MEIQNNTRTLAILAMQNAGGNVDSALGDLMDAAAFLMGALIANEPYINTDRLVTTASELGDLTEMWTEHFEKEI